MITVHHLENSRSQRVLWMLEELGVAYDVKHYARDKKTMLAPPELKAVHPLGKSPVITDGDLVLAESGAILEYLVGRYGNGKFRPAEGTKGRIRYDHFLHFAEGSLMPTLLLKLIFSKVRTGAPFLVRPIAGAIANQVDKAFTDPNIKANFEYLEAELGEGPWFTGEELTAADVQLSYPIEAAMARAVSASTKPRLAAFLERVHERPAYKKALERGGPYTLL